PTRAVQKSRVRCEQRLPLLQSLPHNRPSYPSKVRANSHLENAVPIHPAAHADLEKRGARLRRSARAAQSSSSPRPALPAAPRFFPHPLTMRRAVSAQSQICLGHRRYSLAIGLVKFFPVPWHGGSMFLPSVTYLRIAPHQKGAAPRVPCGVAGAQLDASADCLPLHARSRRESCLLPLLRDFRQS